MSSVVDGSWNVVSLGVPKPCSLCYKVIPIGTSVYEKQTKVLPHCRWVCIPCRNGLLSSPSDGQLSSQTNHTPQTLPKKSAERPMKLKFNSKCIECNCNLHTGDEAQGQKHKEKGWIFRCHPSCGEKSTTPSGGKFATPTRPQLAKTPSSTKTHLQDTPVKAVSMKSTTPSDKDDEYEKDSFLASESDAEGDNYSDESDDHPSSNSGARSSVLTQLFAKVDDEEKQWNNHGPTSVKHNKKKMNARSRKRKRIVSSDEDEGKSEDKQDDDDNDDEEEEGPAEYVSESSKLYCNICGKYLPPDDFSAAQKKEPNSRFCLRHTATSAFGASYRKPGEAARGLRLGGGEASTPSRTHMHSVLAEEEDAEYVYASEQSSSDNESSEDDGDDYVDVRASSKRNKPNVKTRANQRRVQVRTEELNPVRRSTRASSSASTGGRRNNNSASTSMYAEDSEDMSDDAGASEDEEFSATTRSKSKTIKKKRILMSSEEEAESDAPRVHSLRPRRKRFQQLEDTQSNDDNEVEIQIKPPSYDIVDLTEDKYF